MTQIQLTVDRELVQQLFQSEDGVARLLESVLNQVLEAQVSEQLQAEPYERTQERQGYRNGHRDRTLKTRVGTLELQVPRVRSGAFSTELFARYQRSEQALVLALMESARCSESSKGGQWGVHPEGEADHRRAVWDELLQVDRLRVVPGTR